MQARRLVVWMFSIFTGQVPGRLHRRWWSKILRSQRLSGLKCRAPFVELTTADSQGEIFKDETPPLVVESPPRSKERRSAFSLPLLVQTSRFPRKVSGISSRMVRCSRNSPPKKGVWVSFWWCDGTESVLQRFQLK